MNFNNCAPSLFLKRITSPNGESWSYNQVEVPEEIGVNTTGILVNPGHDKWVGKAVLVGLLGLTPAEVAVFDGDLKKISALTGKVFWTYAPEMVTDRPSDYWGQP